MAPANQKWNTRFFHGKVPAIPNYDTLPENNKCRHVFCFMCVFIISWTQYHFHKMSLCVVTMSRKQLTYMYACNFTGETHEWIERKWTETDKIGCKKTCNLVHAFIWQFMHSWQWHCPTPCMVNRLRRWIKKSKIQITLIITLTSSFSVWFASIGEYFVVAAAVVDAFITDSLFTLGNV